MPTITPRIFAHISKIDLEGRAGLQGSEIIPLYQYCAAFLQECCGNSRELIEFTNILALLITSAEQLQSLNDSDDAAGNKLEAWCNEFVAKIIALKPTDSLYLSGGWTNRSGNSHAIIYEFKRTSTGLRFSIYNGGDGIYEHGSIATLTGDRYYSLKSYNISLPLDTKKKELRLLLKRLVVPKLHHHPERKNTHYAFYGKKLYESISYSMLALKATLVTNIPTYLTTEGIVSGTCAQASIQQFLKCYLNNDEMYQRVIVQYKLYTLNDFIKHYPVPRNKNLNKLIQKFIENTLKIIQDSSIFAESEKREKGIILIEMQEKLTDSPETPTTSITTIPKDPRIESLELTQVPPYSTTAHVRTLERITPDNCFDIIQEVLDYRGEDSLWLLQQIERIILCLPLPDPLSSTPETRPKSEPLSSALKWYKEFDSLSWEFLEEQLCKLHTLYTSTYLRQHGKNQLPELLVIEFSFMAILSYSVSQHARINGYPRANPIAQDIAFLLSTLLANYRYCPQLSTHNPIMDERLLQLERLYPLEKNHAQKANSVEELVKQYPWLENQIESQLFDSFVNTVQEGQYIYNESEIFSVLRGFARLSYYKSVLLKSPDLKEQLNKFYENWIDESNPIFHESIRRYGLEAVYVLFGTLSKATLGYSRKIINNAWLSAPLNQTLDSIRKTIHERDKFIKIAFDLNYANSAANMQRRFDSCQKCIKQLDKLDWSNIRPEKFDDYAQETLELEQYTDPEPNWDKLLYKLNVIGSNAFVHSIANYIHILFSDEIDANFSQRRNKILAACFKILANSEDFYDRENYPLIKFFAHVLYLMIYYKSEFLAHVSGDYLKLLSLDLISLLDIAERIIAENQPIRIEINLKQIWPDLIAEYQLFIEETDLLMQPKVRELLNSINLENTIYSSIGTCSNQSLTRIRDYTETIHGPKITLPIATSRIFPGTIQFNSPLTNLYGKDPFVMSNEESNLIHSQYILSNSAPYFALVHDYPMPNSKFLTPETPSKRTSNEIQLYTLSPLQSQLGQLRIRQDLQIQLTLAYFSFNTHLQELVDPNVQSFVKATLLDAKALLPLLKSNPSALKEQFDRFVSQGIRHFSDQATGQMSINALYFIELNVYFLRYLAQLIPFTYDSSLIDVYRFINYHLGIQKNYKIIHKLHQFRFLTTIALHQFEIHDNPKECVESYNHMIKEIILHDRVTKNDLVRAEYCMRNWEEAQYYNPIPLSAQFQAIPENLISDPLFYKLGIPKNTECMVSYNPEKITIMTNPVTVFIRPPMDFSFDYSIESSRDWVVQKNGYQYCPTQPSLHGFPRTFDDENTHIWQRIDYPDDIRIERFNKLCYVLSNDHFQHVTTGARLSYRSYNSSTESVENPSPQLDKLSTLAAFEDLSLITPHVYRDGTRSYDLERYGLSLLQKPNSALCLQENPQYELLSKEASPFAPNVACLTFTNPYAEKYCLVAVQPFCVDYRTEASAGDFYPWFQDTKMVIPNRDKSLASWRYAKSEKYITYNIQNNEPIPKTTADALYLCYIYLATHELDKAWALLQKLQDGNRFTGNSDELLYLYFILTKLPLRFYSNHFNNSLDSYNEAESISPESRACQLKAIFLYTQWMQQGHTANLDDKVKSLYLNLHDHLTLLYIEYQKSRRKLPFSFRLTDEESLSILLCIAPITARSSLIYEKRRLELQELLYLKEQIGRYGDEESIKRTNHIQYKIDDIQDITKIETIAGIYLTNLSLPDKFPDFLEEYQNQFQHIEAELNIISDFLRAPLLANEKSIDEAMQVLSSDISLVNLCTYFTQYVAVAAGENSEHKEELQRVCETLLIGYANKSGKKMSYLLTYLLYRLLHNPNLFSKATKFNTLEEIYSEILKNQQSLPPLSAIRMERHYTNLLKDKNTLVKELLAKPAESLLAYPNLCANPAWNITIPLFETDSQSKAQLTKNTTGISRFFRWGSTQTTISKPDSEETIGISKFKQIKQAQEESQKFLAQIDIQKLLDQTNQSIAETKLSIPIEWNKAFSLVQKLPENEIAHHGYRRELAAKRRQLITNKEQLLTLYFNQRLSTYQNSSALNLEEVVQLHQQIHQCITYELQQLWLVQLKTLLEATPIDSYSVVQHLKHKNLANTPPLMRLQWELKLLLRPEQIDTLTTLFTLQEKSNIIKSLPMGSGKTKILLPALTYQKADGAHLVIIEVPEALLETNYEDHQQTALRLFNQKTYRFQFDRDSDCSPDTLLNIYQHFESVMLHKHALMTTSESIQALELKYKEILLAQSLEQEPSTMVINQIDILGRILRLLRERGIAIVDEAHYGLSPNKSLNYTIGNPVFIPQYQLNNSIELFRFLDCFSERESKAIISRLLSHDKSPLRFYLEGLSTSHITTITDYLQHTPNTDLAILQNLPDEFKEKLAFYRRQLASLQPNEPCLLAQSLSRRYLVDYGPSQDDNKSVVQKALCIPYANNNTPLEGSRFGNPYFEINTSIQGLLAAGLNKPLLLQAIKQWKEDIITDPEKVAPIMGYLQDVYKLKLENIDPDDDVATDDLLQTLKSDHEVIYFILQHTVLPLITVEPKTLSSNSYNHVTQYQQVIGITGNAIQDEVLHQSFTVDNSLSKGNDTYLQHVLIEQKTPIVALDFKNVSELLNSQDKNNNLTAIIDISAHFEGVPNKIIALELAQTIQKYNNDIQYILYFDIHNKLCALSVNPPYEPISIGSTDISVICNKLGNCQIKNLFVYYDQQHTLGTDITLDPNGHALVLTDDTYPNKQGCARMRALEKGQRVTFIVPERLTGVTLDALQNRIDQHQFNETQQTILGYTVNKMLNVIQSDLMERLLSQEDARIQIQFAHAFQALLVKDKTIKKLFDENQINPLAKSSITFLVEYGEQLISTWRTCLNAIGVTPADDLEKTIQEAINTIIQKNKSLYPEQCYQETQTNQVNIVTIYENQNSQTQSRITEHLLEQNFVYEQQSTFQIDPNLKPKVNGELTVKRLNDVIPEANFSDNLRATENYLLTHEKQEDPLDITIKPVQFLYFDASAQPLVACIITAEELDEAKNNVINNDYCWISTLDHTVIAGTKPNTIGNDPEYSRLMEQIYFFNGQLDVLYQNKEHSSWLRENFQTKLDVYTKSIAPYRRNVLSKIETIKSGFTAFMMRSTSQSAEDTAGYYRSI